MSPSGSSPTQITLTQKQRDEIAAQVQDSSPTKRKSYIRRGKVLERVPVSPATLYRWIADGKFPAPIALGGGRAVAWNEDSIDQWMAARESSQK